MTKTLMVKQVPVRHGLVATWRFLDRPRWHLVGGGALQTCGPLPLNAAARPMLLDHAAPSGCSDAHARRFPAFSAMDEGGCCAD